MPRPLMPAALRHVLPQARAVAQDGLRWWLDELQSMIPNVAREAFGDQAAPLLLHPTADGMMVREANGRDLTWLAAGRAGILPADLAGRVAEAGTIIVVLPDAAVLRRILELPLSAERELRAAMTFEIDRQTPFRPDQVYYRYRILRRDLDRKRLRVELVVVPRQTVDEALRAAESHGLVANSVQIEDDVTQPPFDLLPRRPMLQARHLLAEPWRPILAAATLLLLLGLGGIAWYRHDQAQALAAEVAAQRPIGQRVQALRDKIQAAETAAVFLPDRRRIPPAVEILDTLSRVLPDDSWVFGLDVTPKEVRIEGFATDVPAVIADLEKVLIFETPQLRSPVAHSQANSRDRFDLALALRQAAP